MLRNCRLFSDDACIISAVEYIVQHAVNDGCNLIKGIVLLLLKLHKK